MRCRQWLNWWRISTRFFCDIAAVLVFLLTVIPWPIVVIRKLVPIRNVRKLVVVQNKEARLVIVFEPSVIWLIGLKRTISTIRLWLLLVLCLPIRRCCLVLHIDVKPDVFLFIKVLDEVSHG